MAMEIQPGVEWSGGSFVNPDDLKLVQRCIVLVCANGVDGEVHCCGSASLLHYNGEYTMYLTAWHVIEHAMRLVLPLASPLVQPDIDCAMASRYKIFLMSEQFPCGRAPEVMTVIGSPENDLALFISVNRRVVAGAVTKGPKPTTAVITINSDIHPVNTQVLAVLPDIDPPVEESEQSGTFVGSRAWRIRVGRITKIATRSSHILHPLYVTSIPTLPGMSGAPVFAVGRGGAVQMSAIGFVSSDFSDPAAEGNPAVAGMTYLIPSAYAHALMTPLTPPGSAAGSGKKQGFDVLVKNGTLLDAGKNVGNIRIARSEDTDKVSIYVPNLEELATSWD